MVTDYWQYYMFMRPISMDDIKKGIHVTHAGYWLNFKTGVMKPYITDIGTDGKEKVIPPDEIDRTISGPAELFNLIDNQGNKMTYADEKNVPDTKVEESEMVVQETIITSIYNAVAETKQFRKDLDVILQRMKRSPRSASERSVAIRKLTESIMWLGMDLKAQHETNPYPKSYDPTSPVIEPTADGLKL